MLVIVERFQIQELLVARMMRNDGWIVFVPVAVGVPNRSYVCTSTVHQDTLEQDKKAHPTIS
jgi:hypothetical protein